MIEVLTFVGVILTLLTTIVGWIFTYRTQATLLKRQSELAFEKEQRQVLISDRLAFLKSLEEWFEKGRKIYLEVAFITPIIPSLISIISEEHPNGDDSKSKIRGLATDLSKIEQTIGMVKEFRSEGPRHLYLAKIYDPQSNSPQWIWGSSNLPTDLPQIIDAFEYEVIDQASEAEFGEKGRTFPKIEDQFYSLHEAGIQAIERMKGYLITDNRKKKKQPTD